MVNLMAIVSLAAVDAINPCALAVMTMVLVSMLLQNPKEKKKVLFGGLAFTLAVFLLYFLYGLIMIQFFSHLIPESGTYTLLIFKGFGLIAIILGVLNLKDYLNYNPGSVGTEMPMKMRPRVKRLIKKMKSTTGAFIIGMIVTFFLLPCTIGPYIIASGKLSLISFFETIPWLFLYNIIFVIPMVAITLIIYFGVSTVDQVSGWKEKNIRKMHLVEAIILIALGILMITGII